MPRLVELTAEDDSSFAPRSNHLADVGDESSQKTKRCNEVLQAISDGVSQYENNEDVEDSVPSPEILDVWQQELPDSRSNGASAVHETSHCRHGLQ